VSFASLVVYLWLGPAPFLFSDPERAMTFRGLVLLPAACIGALYVAKSIWQWFGSPNPFKAR
jgi:hypothetical protein